MTVHVDHRAFRTKHKSFDSVPASCGSGAIIRRPIGKEKTNCRVAASANNNRTAAERVYKSEQPSRAQRVGFFADDRISVARTIFHDLLLKCHHMPHQFGHTRFLSWFSSLTFGPRFGGAFFVCSGTLRQRALIQFRQERRNSAEKVVACGLYSTPEINDFGDAQRRTPSVTSSPWTPGCSSLPR
jgi:hypothetical protein